LALDVNDSAAREQMVAILLFGQTIKRIIEELVRRVIFTSVNHHLSWDLMIEANFSQ